MISSIGREILKKGDVFFKIVNEYKESIKIIRSMAEKNIINENIIPIFNIQNGFVLGFSEGWRGHILYWIRINKQGQIERCKIVDAFFHD